MKKIKNKVANFSLPGVAIILLFLSMISTGCDEILDEVTKHSNKNPKLLKDFEQVNLVANTDEEYDPARVDPRLVNAWGIAFNPTGVAWVNATGTGLSFIFDKEGAELRPPVDVPSPGAATGGHPTGIIFNGTNDFKLANGNPARFIFDGVDGIISAWNAGNNAVKVVDRSSTSAYTGLALAQDNGANFLYAANFRTGKIDVFNRNFEQVMDKPFTDPGLPTGYSPFNIQAIGDKLYVMYAKVGANGRDEAGQGKGYVDIFNPDGTLVKRFVSKGQLNAPWGIAQAPAGFFGDEDSKGVDYRNAILIGNFGDGRINAYSPSGDFLGQLREHGNPIIIEGLWAIMFPPSTATTVDPNRLYFAAGPDEEEHGLFGYIIKAE
jgi:uncharacterized protein (TIGR03118 family)